MKLKYKKIILMTTMSTMGIGLLTLSISQERPKAEESLNPATQNEAQIELQNDEAEDAATFAADVEKNAVTTAAEPTPTPTPIPSPTPLPVNEIKDSGYEKIDELFKDYYAAKNLPDVEKLKSMLSDPTKVDSEDELVEKTEFIDDYRNIKSYVQEGFREGTYIVYVYHEIKITGVNTPAPGLSKFYLVTDDQGNLKIFSGEMDPELKDYYNARNNDAGFIELKNLTDEKFEEAKKSDEDLFNFWKAIDERSNNGDGAEQTEASAQE